MKKTLAAAFLAAALLCGGASARQPGLFDAAAGVSTSAAGSAERFDLRAPVWEGGTALQRARVNSAVEAEVRRFENHLAELGQQSAVSGAVRWDAGRADGETVSLVVYESTYFDRAAHPTTRAVGMTFDALGHRVTRADVLAMIPQRTAEEINGEIEKQAAERGIPLFPAKWRTVEDWPQEFYVGADNKIYFIFQQYEVAPMRRDSSSWKRVNTKRNKKETVFGQSFLMEKSYKKRSPAAMAARSVPSTRFMMREKFLSPRMRSRIFPAQRATSEKHRKACTEKVAPSTASCAAAGRLPSGSTNCGKSARKKRSTFGRALPPPRRERAAPQARGKRPTRARAGMPLRQK